MALALRPNPGDPPIGDKRNKNERHFEKIKAHQRNRGLNLNLFESSRRRTSHEIKK